MRPQGREGFPDCQVLEGQQDLWDLQDWDFQAHQEREANQEIRDVQAWGVLMAWRGREVILNIRLLGY